ncbi:hypothetical protein HCN44_003843 [Aphidius gifuensis]|uniref:Calpain catalytic domain-containing protein n=1 Tax=Aphidius gifuensis TaxID=684658 RepID=A0A834XY79_APHGI|nr:hypothetical protein HCN44_003843 [Aphidius gifuensis]
MFRSANKNLTEYKNGDIIELQQQDFIYLIKQFLLADKLFKDYQFAEESFSLIENQVLRRPIEIVGDPVFYSTDNKKFHVKQGNLGDCWFIVALVHLQNHKDLFNFIVNPNTQNFDDDSYAGIFHFRFWQGGIWVDVVIDDRLAFNTQDKKLVYASSGFNNEFWVGVFYFLYFLKLVSIIYKIIFQPALVEKAYAKLLYRSYQRLDGGHSGVSMRDFTGGIIETYIVKRSANESFIILRDSIVKTSMISCTTYSVKRMEENNEIINIGLQPNHVYAITDVKIIKGKYPDDEFKLIRLRNPHGKEIENPYHGFIRNVIPKKFIDTELKIKVPGESWILFENFVRFFNFIDICNLTPNTIIGDVYDEDGITKLALSTTDGKWMGGINIKEAKDSDIFGFFPQYRMLTTKPDKGKETCDVLVGLSIKHRYDLVPSSKTLIFFQIVQAHENRAVSKPLKYMEYIPIYPLRRSGQLGVRVNLKPHTTYYIIPFTADTFKGPTFFLQLLSKHDIILEEYDRDIDLPNIEHKFDIIKSAYIQDSDHQLFLNMAFQNDQTIDFKRLYNILRHESFSLNQNCHIIHQLDDSIIPELDLLSDLDDFVPKNILSIASLTKITLLCEEIFERFELPGFRGYSHHSFINRALEKSGYIINANIFNCIYSFCVEENGTVNINDFILIVLNLKSRIGSYYCEEFNAKLTQSLIAMVYNGVMKFKNFDESRIHDLRIDIDQFKIIINFIKEIKEKFSKYLSKSFRSVSYKNLRDTLDDIGYKLTYNMIATIFQKYGNLDDIFFHQFVQAVVDITQIFGKTQQTTTKKEGQNLNEIYNEMFRRHWKKKQERKNSIDKKREADPAWDEGELKKKQKTNN